MKQLNPRSILAQFALGMRPLCVVGILGITFAASADSGGRKSRGQSPARSAPSSIGLRPALSPALMDGARLYQTIRDHALGIGSPSMTESTHAEAGGDFCHGACCNLETEECTDDVFIFDCFDAGGAFSGGLTCAAVSCPPEPQIGACCNPATSECADDVELFECFAMGGTPSIGLTCEEIDCPPVGVCCNTSSGDCEDDVSLPDCQAAGGLFGAGLLCADIECPVIQLGACCDAATGACIEDQQQFPCEVISGGVWSPGAVCNEVDCPPLGACCDGAGGCSENVTEADCTAEDGSWTLGLSCADFECSPEPACGFANPSFETGDLSGWIAQDLAIPFFALDVWGSGVTTGFGFFESAPTDGSFAALHGFDGSGPGTISLAQDVDIPAGTTELLFDYRAAWNLLDFCAQENRTFEVSIQPTGGGAPLSPPVTILTAEAGTIQLDTGDMTGAIDVSAYAGSSVRVSFEWFIPEAFSGPGFFQFDNLRCNSVDPCECVDGQVTICHYPPGNGGNAHTITIGCDALPAHVENHGDTCGLCD